MISDVTDLDVYNRSLTNLDKIYQFVDSFPRYKYKLRSQLVDAAESIPANIAEGFGKKRNVNDAKRFWDMAMGSSDEVITHIRKAFIFAKRYPGIKLNLGDQLILEYKVISK